MIQKYYIIASRYRYCYMEGVQNDSNLGIDNKPHWA